MRRVASFRDNHPRLTPDWKQSGFCINLNVAVGNNSGAIFDVRPYLGVNVVISVGGVEASQSVAGDGFGQLTRQRPIGPVEGSAVT